MSMTNYQYPVPAADPDSSGFWDGAKMHELRIQRCMSCQRFRHPPRRSCPNCHSEATEWVTMSGRGKVYSSIEVYQPVLRMWQSDVPYNIVEIELEDAPGIIITGNVVESDKEYVPVGTLVQVVFDDVTSEITLPRWQKR